MVNKFIFEQLKTIDRLAKVGGFHIYPLRVPDGVEFDEACVYQRISTNDNNLGQQLIDIQVSCFAQSYADAYALANDVKQLFIDRRYAEQGDVIACGLQGSNELPFDDEENVYGVAVNLFIKTTLGLS